MKKTFFLMLAGCLLAMVSTMNAATIADIVIVVDESGSMAGEHAWLPGMVSSLNTKLLGLGYTANFGLIGYGNGISGSNNGRMLLNAGTTAQFATAAANLVIPKTAVAPLIWPPPRASRAFSEL